MLQKVYSVFVKSLLLIVFITASQALFNTVQAQNIIWSAPAGTAWLTASDWTGTVIPTSTQVAEFDVNPTSATIGVGINYPSPGSNQAVGSIYVSSLRTGNLVIGNSSTTSANNGILTLNGAPLTIASVTTNSVVLACFSASQKGLTIQNTQSSTVGASTLTVALNNPNSVIMAGAGTNTANGNDINIVSIISGSNPITFLGNGTLDLTLNTTGLSGGELELGGANTFTGGITVGTSTGGSPTYNNSGVLQLDVLTAINNVSGNNITINNNSQLLLNNTGVFNTSNITLTLNGLGNNANNGVFNVSSSGNGGWTGPIVLATSSYVDIRGSGLYTWSGNISGAGQLQKQGGGTLILSGANTFSGGVQVGNGALTVNPNSSMGTGGIVMAQTSTNNTALNLNNTAQTVSSLSSSFNSGASLIQTQIITLGTNTVTSTNCTLTINQNTNTTYGSGTVSTNSSTLVGPGGIVKSGTGNLSLTSGGNTFSGGINITGGTLTFSPPAATYATTTTSIAPVSQVTLNTGTLSTTGIGANSGFPIYFGALTLSASSTINLDVTNQHSIQFGDSHAISGWSGTLTITNWTGGGTGGSMSGTVGQIFFGNSSSGLTVSQLGHIQFNIGGINYPATILGTGEVVPNLSITTTSDNYGTICTGVPFNVAYTATMIPFDDSIR